MCGRYSQAAEFSEIKLELQVEQLEIFRELTATYNVAPAYAPGFEQPFVMQAAAGPRTLRLGRWWLIPPYWSRPLKELPAAFNARAEDVSRKPFWRGAFESSRCLVPATGWREFRAEHGKKQPYHFQLNRQVFAFAGLWSRWTSPDGETVDSFALITTAPNQQAAAYHQRMPLVMPTSLYGAWLDADGDAAPVLVEACAQSRSLELDVFPTDPIGNNVRFEGPTVIQRIEPAPPALPNGNGSEPLKRGVRSAQATGKSARAARPRSR